MLDKTIVSDVLTAALSTGGNFAEIFMENTTSNTIVMVNGVVEKAQSGLTYGCGLRVFDGYTAVYAYTNDTSKDSLINMAKNTALSISNTTATKVHDFTSPEISSLHKIVSLPNTTQKKDIVTHLLTASDASFKYDNLITQTSNSYIDTIQDVFIANSEGLWVTDRRVRTRVALSAVASLGGEKQAGGFSPGGHVGFELFDRLDMANLGKQSSEIAVNMIKADYCPSGKMPVVIENGFGGVIFHEACGHGLEATSVVKNASVFADKMGKEIASSLVTAVDDGTLPNEWGSQNIDDEGTPTRRNILIENGILKSFLVDKLNGKKMGMPSTGSSRRESYKFPPTSRMTNTFIASGNSNKDDLIKNTEYGLYAKKMGGGSVQPATGQFNFAVTEGYIIENGKITRPVRGATLIGKGSEILLNIDMVSNNLAMEQGVCGSVSGSIPTNVGQPTIRVKGLTVGGRG